MLASRKRQQLTSQSFTPLGSGLYCFDGTRQFWIEQALEQLRATANDHQQVVEVVCNAACQFANSLHLLRHGELLTCFDELLLGVAAFGCVANDAGKSGQIAVVVTNRGKHASNKKWCAVFSDPPTLHLAFALATSQLERPVRFAGTALVRPIQHTEVLADDFVRCITDYFLSRPVPSGDVSGGVENKDCVIGNAIDKDLVMSFQTLESRLCLRRAHFQLAPLRD